MLENIGLEANFGGQGKTMLALTHAYIVELSPKVGLSFLGGTNVPTPLPNDGLCNAQNLYSYYVASQNSLVGFCVTMDHIHNSHVILGFHV
jgi:hypothetical protein